MSTRTWRLGGIAAAVLLLVGAWFAVISPTLSDAAALETETVSQQDASAQLQSRISLLKKQSEELPAQEAKLAAIGQRMPATPALPSLIRNLTTVAGKANVIVASVTPGRPAPVEQEAPAAPPAAAGESEGGQTSESSETAASSEEAPAAGAAPVAPAKATVESIALDITACGTFAQLRNYLRELEGMKRVVTVSALTMTRGACAEGASEDDLTAVIKAYVFMLPDATPPTTASTTDATKGESDE